MSLVETTTVLDGAALVCALLSRASAMMLMLNRVVDSSDDSFCMFASLWQSGNMLIRPPSFRTLSRHT